MDASKRWRRLVEARLAEMERMSPEGGGVGPDYWDPRARRFAAAVHVAPRDPFLAAVRREVTRRSTVIDAGSGPGRFALALAPRVGEVVAVDSSAAMIAILRRRARRLSLANVRGVVGRWEDVDVGRADVVLCSFVLPLVADAATFLAKLDRAARRRVFVYLGALSTDAVVDPFWRHFHGRPRRPGPTYLDAVAVLAELGVRADVDIVEDPVTTRFAGLPAAVRSYRDHLLLPDTADVRAELRRLLVPWLVADGDRLRPPMRSTPAAIVSWGPAGA